MERRSNDERGDGEDEGEDENDVFSEPPDEGVSEEGHLVYDEEGFIQKIKIWLKIVVSCDQFL